MTDWGSDRLPIKIDPTSNGEYRPVPLEAYLQRANALAAERITEHAARTGVGRRAFLQSVCGAATTLWTLNEAFAAKAWLRVRSVVAAPHSDWRKARRATPTRLA